MLVKSMFKIRFTKIPFYVKNSYTDASDRNYHRFGRRPRIIRRYKCRPVIVLGGLSRRKAAVLAVTSKFKTKSPAIRCKYCPIFDWRASGLRKPSYIDVNQVYVIWKKTLSWGSAHQAEAHYLSFDDCQRLIWKMRMIVRYSRGYVVNSWIGNPYLSRAYN